MQSTGACPILRLFLGWSHACTRPQLEHYLFFCVQRGWPLSSMAIQAIPKHKACCFVSRQKTQFFSIFGGSPEVARALTWHEDLWETYQARRALAEVELESRAAAESGTPKYHLWYLPPLCFGYTAAAGPRFADRLVISPVRRHSVR